MSIELKLLEYNFYDVIDDDNYNKYKDSKKFVVQMFGLNEKRETFSLLIDDFKPYFFIHAGRYYRASSLVSSKGDSELFLQSNSRSRTFCSQRILL